MTTTSEPGTCPSWCTDPSRHDPDEEGIVRHRHTFHPGIAEGGDISDIGVGGPIRIEIWDSLDPAERLLEPTVYVGGHARSAGELRRLAVNVSQYAAALLEAAERDISG